MRLLWLRRAFAWLFLLGVSAAYWIELAPLLHKEREYKAALIIYVAVVFATFFAVGLSLKLANLMSRNGSGRRPR